MTQATFWPSAIKRKIAGDHGKKAARAGKGFEKLVTTCAVELDCRVVSKARTSWTGFYGEKIEVDHIVHGLPGFPDGLAVETRYQNSDGTAYKKMHYLVDNILINYRLPTIIVYGGAAKGMHQAAQYIKRRQVDGIKLIACFTLDEWFAWLERQMTG